jgi:hypothetical protein
VETTYQVVNRLAQSWIYVEGLIVWVEVWTHKPESDQFQLAVLQADSVFLSTQVRIAAQAYVPQHSIPDALASALSAASGSAGFNNSIIQPNIRLSPGTIPITNPMPGFVPDRGAAPVVAPSGSGRVTPLGVAAPSQLSSVPAGPAPDGMQIRFSRPSGKTPPPNTASGPPSAAVPRALPVELQQALARYL